MHFSIGLWHLCVFPVEFGHSQFESYEKLAIMDF